MPSWIEDMLRVCADLAPYAVAVLVTVLLVARAVRAHKRPLEMTPQLLAVMLAYTLYSILVDEAPLLEATVQFVGVAALLIAFGWFLDRRVLAARGDAASSDADAAVPPASTASAEMPAPDDTGS